MKPDDGRKLDHETLEVLRRRAVERVAAGASAASVAEALGLARSTVSGWVAAYRKGGPDVLRARVATGRPVKLNKVQLCRLFTMLAAGDPACFGLSDSALWTRELICRLVDQQFCVSLSAASVARLVRRLGVPTTAPLRRIRALGDDDRRWVEESYPQVKAMARTMGAPIVFIGHEVAHWDAENCVVSGGGGSGPAVFTSTVIFTVGVKQPQRLRLYEGAPSGAHAEDFCKRLLRDTSGPLCAVVDRVPGHDRSTRCDPRVIRIDRPCGVSAM